MQKHFLFTLPADDTQATISPDSPQMLIRPTLPLEVDDKVLLYNPALRTGILPYINKVVSVNYSTGIATLRLEDTLPHTVPIDFALSTFQQHLKPTLSPTEKNLALQFLERHLTHPGNVRSLSSAEFSLLQEKMHEQPLTTVTNDSTGKSATGKKNTASTKGQTTSIPTHENLTEKALLEHVRRYIEAKGFYFDYETLCNYHICLKTRPFVILAGLSGTGKSRLSQLYAEALGYKDHYLRLAVRPNWNDDHYLLGYLNVITGEYITEQAIDFVLDASQDPHNLYFLCLDEMNLAHVEYYFSQFLSALEEEDPDRKRISLVSEKTYQMLALQGKNLHVPPDLLLPSNLLFTGTINVDETTQSISDKVIDRANTLEFFKVSINKLPDPRPPIAPLSLSAADWQKFCAKSPNKSYRTQLDQIIQILNKADMGLGYRVIRDIEMYLAHSKDLLPPLTAFDLQVKQRILPRIRGTEVISAMLNELLAYMQQHNLQKSFERLSEMEGRLKRDGYTSFWR